MSHNASQMNNFSVNSGCDVEKNRYAVVLTQMNGSLSRAEQLKTGIYAYSNHPSAPHTYT